jgi:hypothetical protein
LAINITCAPMGSAIALAYGFIHCSGARFIDHALPTEKWQADHAYAISSDPGVPVPCVLGSDGNLHVLIVAGTSGSTEPTWENLYEWDSGARWHNIGGGQDGSQIGFWLLGEGEWDGFNSLYNQGAPPLGAFAFGYDPTTGLYGTEGPNVYEVHFHAGCDTPLGSPVTPGSTGPDQLCDAFWSDMPGGLVPLCYSRMAYYAIKWKPPFYQVGGTLDPIGNWRSMKCRIFDDTGTQTDYKFTTNPAWHWVDAWLRRAILPNSEYYIDITAGIQAIPDDAKDKFDWGSVVEFANDCDYVLANGRKRFEGSYAFAGQTTLAAILEQILLCSRGYQQESAGKLFVAMDKPRSSVFTLTSKHLIPGTFKVDDTTVHQGANDYNAAFLDTNIPAISDVDSITNVAGGYTGPGGPGDLATIVTVEKNPVALNDWIVVGGNDNPLLNIMWLVSGSDVGVDPIIDDYTFTARPVGPVGDQTGSGGVLGYPQARFSKRTPRIIHNRHAMARGAIGR